MSLFDYATIAFGLLLTVGFVIEAITEKINKRGPK